MKNYILVYYYIFKKNSLNKSISLSSKKKNSLSSNKLRQIHLNSLDLVHVDMGGFMKTVEKNFIYHLKIFDKMNIYHKVNISKNSNVTWVVLFFDKID